LGGSSLFEAVARALAPVFRPLGWGDWRFAGALLPGAVAKEVILGSLGVTMLGAEPSVPLSLLEGLRHLGTALLGALRGTATGLVGIGGAAGPDASGPLGSSLAAALSAPAALSFLVFSLLYVPCVATLAALRRQFGTRWALFSAGYQVGVAYLAALLVFTLFRLG
jgi:ferrous iron transport protein B